MDQTRALSDSPLRASCAGRQQLHLKSDSVDGSEPAPAPALSGLALALDPSKVDTEAEVDAAVLARFSAQGYVFAGKVNLQAGGAAPLPRAAPSQGAR